MRAFCLILFFLSTESALAQGTSRISLKDLEAQMPKRESVTNRFVGNTSTKLIAACKGHQIIESATCEAQEAGVFGFDSLIRTRTEIVTIDLSQQAECSAVNVRMDQSVRLTLVLNCSLENSNSTAQN